MSVSTFLKNKQRKIQSKYHQVTKRVELKYELIHRKLTSRFHRETTETEIIRSKINNLITQSTESIDNQIRSKRLRPFFSKRSTKIEGILYLDIIDWYQGRFSGKIIRIIVREGKIIEKVFLTPKGNKISIKRGHILFRLRSLPIIQIKLKLSSRLIKNTQRNLKSISLIRT